MLMDVSQKKHHFQEGDRVAFFDKNPMIPSRICGKIFIFNNKKLRRSSAEPKPKKILSEKIIYSSVLLSLCFRFPLPVPDYLSVHPSLHRGPAQVWFHHN